MVLVRPDDLVAMLGDLRIEVEAVYDEGEVTLSVPSMGILGFGGSLDEATTDLLAELRAYAARYFQDPTRYLATARRGHAGPLLQFALADEEAQRQMLVRGGGRPVKGLVNAG